MENNNRLSGLIDSDTIKRIETSLSSLLDMAVRVSDENGAAIGAGAGFSLYAEQCMATPVGMQDCERCIIEGAVDNTDMGQLGRAECFGGLAVFSAPIKAADETAAILSAGWVLTAAPDSGRIRENAEMIGADTDILCENIGGVRVIDEEEAERVCEYIREYARILSDMLNKSYEIRRVSAAHQHKDFLSGVSKDMRAPINEILGMTEQAGKKDAKTLAAGIRSSTGRLISIADNIADYSDLNFGELPITNDRYDPRALVDGIAQAVNSLIGIKHIEFTIDFPMSFPRALVGDCGRIKQVLMYLLDNAVKFTSRGHIGLALKAIPKNDNEIWFRAEVSDTGCGIIEDKLDKILVMFKQDEPEPPEQGSGLGLIMAQKLIKLMKGTISARSVLQSGSKFFFEIPQQIAGAPYANSVHLSALPVHIIVRNQYQREQLMRDLKALDIKPLDISARPEACKGIGYVIAAGECVSAAVRQLFYSHPELRGVIFQKFDNRSRLDLDNVETIPKPAYSLSLYEAMGLCDEFDPDEAENINDMSFTAPDARVLIVDDNDINLTVAKSAIEPLGIQIDTAASAEEAIERAKKTRYDLVFMDQMMPGIDGIQATQMIREQLPDYSGVPIIALSANDSADAGKMFRSKGLNDFVAKPIELKSVIGKIRRWLSKDKIVPTPPEPPRTEAAKPDYGDLPQINGIDLDSALSLINNRPLLRNVMQQFYRSIDRKVERIRTLMETKDIKNFTIEVHALKSAARQIGANHISTMAARLEDAGKENDAEFINRHTNTLLIEFLMLKKNMAKFFGEPAVPEKPEAPKPEKAPEPAPAEDLFKEMREALEEMDSLRIDDVMEKMISRRMNNNEVFFLEELRNAIEEFDLDAAQKILDEYEKARNKGNKA